MNLWRVQPQAFEGLAERCAPGVPEAAVALLARHDVRSVPVLDLASGSGAFLARLRKGGFTDLTAVELDSEKFGFREITPLVVNLNQSFASSFSRQFGLVTATEIIEHLESPRHFLREIHALLQPSGYLLLSTPNVTNFEGRLKFLLQGELRYFDAAQYRYNHHISPITDTQMRLLLVEVGFQIIESIQSGSFSGALRRIFFPGGEVNLYLARKSAPQTNVPIDWSR
jgi:2-polyprenyl-3-methyl-5-hydroxy-6-metoxy-1,4-benzoquinol methylase